MTNKNIKTQCCIAGGGPAGMMLGYLLARKGIEVVVLEKYPDFFRDFRGDTIHPSIMDLLEEIGLIDEFFKLPHEKTYKLAIHSGDKTFTLVDFKKLKIKHPFIAFIPQWDFLNFISEKAKKHPNFKLLMETEATGLIKKKGRVIGLKAKRKRSVIQIDADLVVGADGRDSIIRKKAGLKVKNYGAPMDVLWFKVPRIKTDPKESFGSIGEGQLMVMIQRETYWQCGFIIKKGHHKAIKKKGLKAFRKSVQELAPFLGDRVTKIKSLDDLRFLLVQVNRLGQWADEGVLCIGDAAHAMSPIGGLGINVAIQDAVAAANVLYPAFQKGVPNIRDLKRVQKRRSFVVRILQFFQLTLQKQLIAKVLKNKKPPIFLRIIQKIPLIRKIPAYMIAIGPRPVHLSKALK